ncbi:ciliary-associated calcium-binding coiled-coil protein 1-like [Saccoglossus kowalevskii]
MSDRRLSRKGSSLSIRRGSLPVSGLVPPPPSMARRMSLQPVRGQEGSAASTSSSGSRRTAHKGEVIRDDEAKAQEREGSLAWKVLSNTQTQMLQELTVEDLEKKLAEIFKLTSNHINLNEGVLLDYYVTGFWWAKDQSFSTQQISGFITVLHTLLENIKESKMTLVDNLKEFKKMLPGIGNENSDISGGLDFFDINQAKTITDYLKQTIFQHYKMYEFLCHDQREEQIVCRDLLIEVLPKADLPYPPPLDEGIDQNIYDDYIATPRETPTSQDDSGDGIDGQEDAAPSLTQSPVEAQTEKVESEEDAANETEDLLSGVTADDIKRIMDEVAQDMFGGLQAEVGKKLKDREAEIIARINKIHRIADA